MGGVPRSNRVLSFALAWLEPSSGLPRIGCGIDAVVAPARIG
jgi:hypothetical protein